MKKLYTHRIFAERQKQYSCRNPNGIPHGTSCIDRHTYRTPQFVTDVTKVPPLKLSPLTGYSTTNIVFVQFSFDFLYLAFFFLINPITQQKTLRIGTPYI